MLRAHWRLVPVAVLLVVLFACAPGAVRTDPGQSVASPGTLAQVYYWRARAGMVDAYNRYIREVAEPIDAEAHRQGAFISVTTYQTSDTLSPWTHMRIFILRDSAQLAGLSAALAAAGVRVEPDSIKRRQTANYAATLRDRVGSAVLEILR